MELIKLDKLLLELRSNNMIVLGEIDNCEFNKQIIETLNNEIKSIDFYLKLLEIGKED